MKTPSFLLLSFFKILFFYTIPNLSPSFLFYTNPSFLLAQTKSLPQCGSLFLSPVTPLFVETQLKKFVTPEDLSLFYSQNFSFSFKNIIWSIRFMGDSPGPIQVIRLAGPPEKIILAIPENSFTTPELFEKLLRQWLVGHPLHPYLNKKNLQLKDFQKEALEAYDASRLRGDQKLLLVSPGSTGKTLVLGSILQQNLTPGRTTVILADQKLLLAQLKKTLPEIIGSTFSESSLYQWGNGEPVSSMNPFLTKVFSTPNKHHLLFSTVASFKSGLAKMQNLGLQQDFLNQVNLIIYDEAHHSGAPQIKSFIKSLSSLEKPPFLLGITATPIHHNENILQLYDGHAFWAYLQSSFKAESYPKPLTERHTEPLTESQALLALQENVSKPSVSSIVTQMELATKSGDITPFNTIQIFQSFEKDPSSKMVTPEEAQSLQSHPSFFIQEKVNDTSRFVLNPTNYPEVFSKIQPLIENKAPGFIIASTIKESQRLYEHLTRAFPNKKFSLVHSYLEKKEMDFFLEAIQLNQIDFVIAVRMLDEGINIPHFRTYIDLTPSFSPKQLLQRLSRITRLSEGKTSVDMTFFYSVSQETLKESITVFDHMLKNDYQSSFQTLRKPQDIDLFEKGFLPEPGKDPFYTEIEQLKISLESFWSQSQVQYENSRLRDFQHFIRTYKRLPRKSGLSSSFEKTLFSWYYKFKESHSQWITLLDQDVQDILSNAGLPSNKGRAQRQKQEDRLKSLQDFIREHKTLPSSSKAKSSEERSLALWFNQFKSDKSNPKKWITLLDPDVRALIEDPFSSMKLNKNQRFKEFENFVRTHKALPQDSDGVIGFWFSKTFTSKRSSLFFKLDPDVQDILKSIGYHSHAQKPKDDRLRELNEFIRTQRALPSKKMNQSLEETTLSQWFISSLKPSNPRWVESLDPDVQKIIQEKNLNQETRLPKGVRLKKLHDFIRKKKDIPRASKNSSLEERELAIWLAGFKFRNPDWFQRLDADVQKILE
jgi:superfamily II DNA or RNA helicase